MNTLWQLLFVVIAFGLGYEAKARLEPWIERKRAYKKRSATRRAKRRAQGIPDSVVIKGESYEKDNG